MSTQNFAMAYGKLPGNMQSNIRDEVMIEAGWKTTQYFSMKKNGTRALTDIEKNAVERVFCKYGYDAWTGEPINA